MDYNLELRLLIMLFKVLAQKLKREKTIKGEESFLLQFHLLLMYIKQLSILKLYEVKTFHFLKSKIYETKNVTNW